MKLGTISLQIAMIIGFTACANPAHVSDFSEAETASEEACGQYFVPNVPLGLVSEEQASVGVPITTGSFEGVSCLPDESVALNAYVAVSDFSYQGQPVKLYATNFVLLLKDAAGRVLAEFPIIDEPYRSNGRKVIVAESALAEGTRVNF